MHSVPPRFKSGEVLSAEKLNQLADSITGQLQVLTSSHYSRFATTEPRRPLATAAPQLFTLPDFAEDGHEADVYILPAVVSTDAAQPLTTIGSASDAVYGQPLGPAARDLTNGTVWADVSTDVFGRPTATQYTFRSASATAPVTTLPNPQTNTTGRFFFPLADVARNPWYAADSEEARFVTLRHVGDLHLPPLLLNERATGDLPGAPGSPHSAPIVKGRQGAAWTLRQLTEGGGVSISIPHPEGDMMADTGQGATVPDDIVLTCGHYHIGYNWATNTAPGTPPPAYRPEPAPYWKTVAVLDIVSSSPGTPDAPGTPEGGQGGTSTVTTTTRVELQTCQPTPWSTAYRFNPATVNINGGGSIIVTPEGVDLTSILNRLSALEARPQYAFDPAWFAISTANGVTTVSLDTAPLTDLALTAADSVTLDLQINGILETTAARGDLYVNLDHSAQPATAPDMDVEVTYTAPGS